MKEGRKNFLRVVSFFMVVILMLVGLNGFFQPVWAKWNNYYTTHGFYEEPENTIEALFVGASIVLSSITPMELYDDYGICAYNIGTEQQPMLASYYWLEEAYRLHGDSLKTVILDASGLRSGSKEGFYHKALDSMKFSDVKLRAIHDYTDGSIYDMITFGIPLAAYHDRWSDLEVSDFEKYSYDADIGTRGYYYIENIYADKVGFEETMVFNPVLDKTANEEGLLLEDSLYYFDKMVKFCEEKGLDFVLMKTISKKWSSELHNAVAEVADGYGIEFLDFNFDPLYDVYGHIHAFDNRDGNHLNYYGATKFTKWMGNYLVQNFDLTDVRGLEKYAFMEKQYDEYSARILQQAKLLSAQSLVEYLEIAASGNNTVLIASKGEASAAIEQRELDCFSKLKLDKLSTIAYRDSYYGVINNGKVVAEGISLNGATKEPVTYRGTVGDGSVSCDIKCAGTNNGNTAEIKINGEAVLSEKNAKRGVNIVVYSNDLGCVINSTNFDTFQSCNRSVYGLNNTYLLVEDGALDKTYDPITIEGQIVEYNERVSDLRVATLLEQKVGKNNLLGFLEEYMKDENNVIYLSVCREASTLLTDYDRQQFEALGLVQLSKLKEGNSYISCIRGDEIVFEKRAKNKIVVNTDIEGVYLKSVAGTAGKISSVEIFGKEFSPNKRGINVVVYNQERQRVIDTRCFDTHTTPLLQPQTTPVQ